MGEGEDIPSRPEGRAVTETVAVEGQRGPARKAYATRNLTEGSIPRSLWFLAWPQTVEGVLNVTDQLADVLWAGRLGATSIAGLGVAQSYAQLAMTGRMGFDTAMRAMVSRAVGAQNIPLANYVALQAFTLSGAFSILMVLIGVFLTEPLMRLIGVSESVIGAGADYMRVMFIGQGGIAFRMMSGAALQASGDAVTPMKATTVARVVHISLSPCLVFGLLFFPELDLAGAAVANVVAQFFGVAMNFFALFTGRSRLHLSFNGYRVDFPLLWQIVKLGAPASVTTAERTIAQIMLIGLVAPFGDYALAAYSLTRRAEMLTNLGSMGIGQSCGILAGQCLGAGKPERAKSTVRWALGFATASHFIVAAILFTFPEPILSLFNQQPELLGPGVVWLRLQAISYVFMGASVVFMQTYNTAGDTFIPMVVTLISIWGVQQPLALVLPNFWNLGQFGIAWAINLAIIVRLFFYVPYFFTGRWMKKNLLKAPRPGGMPASAH